MAMIDDVNGGITAAMKAHDTTRLSTLRMLKAALTNREVEKGRPLDHTESLQVVTTLVKQRRDAIEQFTRGRRTDLADRETAEIAVLETFLPPPLTAAELESAVDAAIAETGASSPKDVGKVMKAVMSRLADRAANGKVVNEVVRRKLAS